ncbi:Cytochrome c551/c552 [Halopseudomonas formosensis]|uniref:Cytochrome c-551 n=1 Tax=Halopseudomonas formosensis TaxID=1002526 RepID=A0A1I6BR46_9GAMM|nr:c-type cytochrome [Halopseudomonas formosensis]SFQ83402.1 Cytochrome c551/c552 [Halopseudomonas formosensis]
MTIAKNILAASAAVLALFAGSAQATTDEAIAERIKPYGTVCVAGDPCAEAVAAAPAGEAAGEAAGGNPGEALFSAKACVACHSVDNKVVGPAMKEVAAKYAGDADHIINSIKNGSQGNWGPIPMPPNAVNDEEAAQLAEWILSLN